MPVILVTLLVLNLGPRSILLTLLIPLNMALVVKALPVSKLERSSDSRETQFANMVAKFVTLWVLNLSLILKSFSSRILPNIESIEVTELVSKFRISSDSSLVTPPNILSILVTLEVSKLETLSEVRPEQLKNIFCMLVTLEVSKWLTSSEDTRLNPLNILSILTALEVSKLEIFKLVKAVLLINMREKFFTFLVLKFEILRFLRDDI